MQFSNNRILLFVALMGVGTCRTYAQHSDPWADSVVVFEPGSGQNFGQQPPYFPNNVLGPPDKNAKPTVPSADPNEILSLGLGGRIVLAFTDNLIIDGPGADFTVFENAFIRQFGPAAGLPFAEPARVAVSRDGITFVAFPFDSLTLKGLAGVTPTNGCADPTHPDSAGGDSFDLADLGIDSVRFVELVDVTSLIKDNPNHPYWDPTLSGFDLDAVVAVHSAPVRTDVKDRQTPGNTPSDFHIVGVFPNPVQPRFHDAIRLAWRQQRAVLVEMTIVNLLGQKILNNAHAAYSPGHHLLELPVKNFAAGLYFLVLHSASTTEVRRFRVLK